MERPLLAQLLSKSQSRGSVLLVGCWLVGIGVYWFIGSGGFQQLSAQGNAVEQQTQSLNQDTLNQRFIPSLRFMLTGVGITGAGLLWANYLIKKNLQTQRRLAFQVRRSEVLLDLPKYAEALDEVAFLQQGQEFAEELTDSKIAFIHFVNDDEQTIELVAWSQATLAHYCRAVADHHYPVDKAGIWADALRLRHPVVVNDYAAHAGKKGLPEGHAHLERLISVPVIDNGKVVMLTGVGNKNTPYTDGDVETVQLISNLLWRITVSRRLHRELSVRAERYRSAQAIAKIGNWELDFRTNELFWSPEVFELFGVDSQRFAASYEGFLSAIHPGDRDWVDKAYQEHLYHHQPYDIVHRLLMPDGQVKYVHEQCTTLFDEDNKPLLSRGTIQDVTQLTQAQLSLEHLNAELEQRIQARTQELENSEARYRGLLDHAGDAILLADPQGNLVECNRQAELLLGYSAGELKGMKIWQIHPADQHDIIRQGFEGVLEGQGNPFTESLVLRKDGTTCPIEISPSLMTIDGQTHIQGIFRDITERKTVEKELMQAKLTAEAATRAKSEFLANMSHEIRTPMNAILGMSELVLQTDLTEQQRNYLQKVQHAGELLLGIINDILDFSKIEAGKLELEQTVFSLEEVVANLQSILAIRAEDKGLALSFELDTNIPPILVGDPLRLSQILVNLGNNAIKFTHHGQIDIQGRLLEVHGDRAKIQFSVTDTGIGLTPAQKDKLFHGFTQADTSTSRQYGGTGLGLVISKTLTEMMGGRVWLESTPGQGSTFYFTVNLGQASPELSAHYVLNRSQGLNGDQAVTQAIADLQGARILLVEDNEINQEFARDLLVSKGLVVEIANDGREALDLLAIYPYDAVLMDIQMPVLNGYDATQAIRQQPHFQHLPIIAMTANAMAGDRQKALDAGMNDHIAKPVKAGELFQTLTRWIKPQQTIPAIAPESDLPFPPLMGIDQRTGMENIENVALYHRLLLKFRDRYPDVEAQFRAEQTSDDPLAPMRFAHSLKGTAALLGMASVRLAALNLERGCEENQGEAVINAHLQAVKLALNPVLKALQGLADTLP